MTKGIKHIRSWCRTNGVFTEDNKGITYNCEDLEEVIQQALNMHIVGIELKEKNTPNLREWAKQQGYTLTAQEFIKDGLLFSVSDIYSKYIAREE